MFAVTAVLEYLNLFAQLLLAVFDIFLVNLTVILQENLVNYSGRAPYYSRIIPDSFCH